MSERAGSLEDLTSRIRAISPEYLNLFVAENDYEFESAFNVLLKKAVENLEANSKNYKTLNEEGLSGVLAAGLTVPGLAVTQETNSNGHVDITIHAECCNPQRKKLAEAKIYDGKKYHIEGVEQLLGYMTGRETQGLMLMYVRKKNIAGIIKKLRDNLDTEKPQEQQGATSEHALKWSFISTHKHSSGEDLGIGHVGCNLYVPPKKVL